MPKSIATVHRKLMMNFFERAHSSALINHIRELFAVDIEGYLIPVYLFSKIIPSLRNGLKLIGMIRRAYKFSFDPKVPARFSNVGFEYLLCDKDYNVLNFTYGMTIEFGYFPKLFS